MDETLTHSETMAPPHKLRFISEISDPLQKLHGPLRKRESTVAETREAVDTPPLEGLSSVSRAGLTTWPKPHLLNVFGFAVIKRTLISRVFCTRKVCTSVFAPQGKIPFG